MAKTDKTAPEDAAADDTLKEDATTTPRNLAQDALDTRPLREDLPTNDEPPIPLTAGAEESFKQAAVLQPVTPPAPRVVEAPRLPDNVEVPTLRRRVTIEDVNSPGYSLLIGGAKENFDAMVLRPGDRVAAGVEVIGLHNINERIELRPGAVVPEGDTGYVPTNYIMDHQRQRMIHDQAEAQIGNRKR